MFSLILAALAIASPLQEESFAVMIENAFDEPVSPLAWCGKPSDGLTLEKVVLTPYPVIAGNDLVVTVSGILKNDVQQGAKARVVAKIGFVPVLTTDIDICAQVPGGCPLVTTGKTQSLDITQSIPGLAPEGNLKVEIAVSNGNGEPIACLKGAIKVVKQA